MTEVNNLQLNRNTGMRKVMFQRLGCFFVWLLSPGGFAKTVMDLVFVISNINCKSFIRS